MMWWYASMLQEAAATVSRIFKSWTSWELVKNPPTKRVDVCQLCQLCSTIPANSSEMMAKTIKTHAKASGHQKIAVLAACSVRCGRIEMLSASCVRWSYDCSTPIPSSVRRSYVTLCGKRLVDVNWRWPPWMGKSFGQSFYQAGPYCIEVSNSHSNSEELSQRPNWWTKLNPTRMFGILESQNVLVFPQFIHYSPLVQSLNSTGGAPKSFGISSRSNLSWPQRKSRTDATLFSRQTGLPAEVRCLQASVVHQHHWGHPFVFI